MYTYKLYGNCNRITSLSCPCRTQYPSYIHQRRWVDLSVWWYFWGRTCLTGSQTSLLDRQSGSQHLEKKSGCCISALDYSNIIKVLFAIVYLLQHLCSDFLSPHTCMPLYAYMQHRASTWLFCWQQTGRHLVNWKSTGLGSSRAECRDHVSRVCTSSTALCLLSFLLCLASEQLLVLHPLAKTLRYFKTLRLQLLWVSVMKESIHQATPICCWGNKQFNRISTAKTNGLLFHLFHSVKQDCSRLRPKGHLSLVWPWSWSFLWNFRKGKTYEEGAKWQVCQCP